MEAKNNILLVPTDFSEVGTNAINLAAKAAKLLEYKMCLLHVTDGKDDATVEEKLNVLAEEAKNTYGIEVDSIAREGSIFTTIGEVAKEINAALVYLGTHGKVGMQKVTGSYALKVVTSSEVPVIIVQKRSFEQTKDIVLPITSDSGPWEKTKWATEIAKEFNAKIHIYQIDTEAVDRTVEMISGYFKENDVEFTVNKTEKGAFEKNVIDFATGINADLIMIMTNPDKGIAKFILGSYDEDMIFNASQIPVMCINPRDYNWRKIVSR